MTDTTAVSREVAHSAVRTYLDTIAAATSADDIAALYAEGATVEDPAGSAGVRGKAAIAEFFAPLVQTTRETELLEFRHSGNSAAFHFRVRTHTPDGIVEIEPMDVMTFAPDGSITSAVAYWSAEDVRTP